MGPKLECTAAILRVPATWRKHRLDTADRGHPYLHRACYLLRLYRLQQTAPGTLTIPKPRFSRLKDEVQELFRVAGMCAGGIVTTIVPRRIEARFLHTLVGVHHRLRSQ